MRFSLILLLLFIFSCKQNGSEADKPAEQLLDSVYTITALVNGVDTGTAVILEFEGIENRIDTTYIKGNTFEFKGSAKEPLVANIYIVAESHDKAEPLKIVVENSIINIEGTAESFNTATVIGGIGNTDFNTLKKTLRIYEDSMEVVGIKVEEAKIEKDSALATNLHKQYFTLEKEKSTLIKQFAIEHPKSIAGAYYVSAQFDYTAAELDTIYNAFDSTIKNSIYVYKIKESIDAFKRTAAGQLAPGFEIPNANGKTVSLSSLKGKYLFIDFWASWCEPCRAENPSLVKTYKQYKGKDFEIVGVSLDDNKQEWLQAVRQDKLTWLQLNDLKGWESNLVSLYGIKGIPVNFLLDKEGKIIARDLHGDQLQKKLEELLQKPTL